MILIRVRGYEGMFSRIVVTVSVLVSIALISWSTSPADDRLVKDGLISQAHLPGC